MLGFSSPFVGVLVPGRPQVFGESERPSRAGSMGGVGVGKNEQIALMVLSSLMFGWTAWGLSGGQHWPHPLVGEIVSVPVVATVVFVIFWRKFGGNS